MATSSWAILGEQPGVFAWRFFVCNDQTELSEGTCKLATVTSHRYGRQGQVRILAAVASLVLVCVMAVSTAPAPAAVAATKSTKASKQAVKKASKKPAKRPVKKRVTTTKRRKARPLPTVSTVALAPSTLDPNLATTIAAPATLVPTLPTTVPAPTNPASTNPATSVAPTTVALPTPQEYLDRALRFIETYSARSRSVDIAGILAAARAKGAGVQTIPETYPIIKEALVALGDRHSQLLDPAAARSLLQGTGTGFGLKIYPPDVIWVTPGSPAELGGIRTLDRLVSFNGKPWNRTTTADRAVESAVVRVFRANVGEFDVSLTRAPLVTNEAPSGRVLDAKLGYIDLPGSTGSRTSEENFVRTGIATISGIESATNPCGWVLDLRRNSGGFVYSMMATLEPFLSETTFAGFVFGDGRREMLSFKNNQLLAGTRVGWQLESSIKLRDPNVPVAVLSSNFTGSAGELAMISFIGRPNSRSFGAQTVGVTSANVGITLADGAFIMVTNSYDLDRNGTVYDQKLQADVGLTVDWSVFGTDADPVLAQARQWLASQPACAGR